MKKSVKALTTLLSVLLMIGCNGEFNKQLELAKKEKCELFAKYEQLKIDSANSSIREVIKSMERMLDTHEELSGNPEKFSEELKNHPCK